MAGCSNHGCYIDPLKTIGTNGMCHCLEPLGKENALALTRRLHLYWRLQEAAKIAFEDGDWTGEVRNSLLEAIQMTDPRYDPWGKRKKENACTQ